MREQVSHPVPMRWVASILPCDLPKQFLKRSHIFIDEDPSRNILHANLTDQARKADCCGTPVFHMTLVIPVCSSLAVTGFALVPQGTLDLDSTFELSASCLTVMAG